MKLTREKKFFPLLLRGFELATFRSQGRRSYQQAIPASCIEVKQIIFYPVVLVNRTNKRERERERESDKQTDRETESGFN